MTATRSNMPARALVNLAGLLALAVCTAARGGEDGRWWPVQALPQGIVRTVPWQSFDAPRKAHEMLVQSLAGLAAQAVNGRRGDELVWVATKHVDLEEWLRRMLAAHPQVQDRGVFRPWELVDRYAAAGLVKGYILYTQDSSPGKVFQPRPAVDCSANVATSLAGLLGGILVEEQLEPVARRHGLKLLFDARHKSQQWCFETYKDRFNRHMLCTQDPQVANVRDLAIAARAFTASGLDEPLPAALRWLEPPSPILGWNMGDEFKVTRASTVCGHFQTATNWCMNLPVLMAGSPQRPADRAEQLDPRKIDFHDHRSMVSFISTDGDNVQWYEAGFFRNSRDYWSSPDRGRIPFGWSCCFSQLAQLCPQAMQYAVETRTGNDWFVEWGGGYYYPDLFALERPNRWQLLAREARRTWAMMTNTGTRIIGFNFARCDSPDALRAYEVFARETDGLLAILVFQYSPYEAGAGKTFWVKDGRGMDVPVITARYSIWANNNQRPRSGTPAKVAREIRESVAAAPPAELPRYDWAITHVWSYFRHAPGTDEAAENFPPEAAKRAAAEEGGIRGYTPVVWCAERLPQSIGVVSPEELAWRIRMKHNPRQTRALISAAEAR
jgi:hypothetical protein